LPRHIAAAKKAGGLPAERCLPLPCPERRIASGAKTRRDGNEFGGSREEREKAGDPRPSLAERYGGRDGYVARVKAAVEALVAARLLLPEDAAACLSAAARCDRF
jgi:hypothetical protein